MSLSRWRRRRAARALAAGGFLDARTGTYRASQVALYSCYQLSYVPARSTDKRMARPADITWHSHCKRLALDTSGASLT